MASRRNAGLKVAGLGISRSAAGGQDPHKPWLHAEGIAMLTRVAEAPLDAGDVLAQHLTSCPSCGSPAAAHVAFEQGDPILVRIVCASGCPDNDTARVAVIDALYGAVAV